MFYKIVFLILVVVYNGTCESTCRTPNDGAGDCIPIAQCHSFSPVPWKGGEVTVSMEEVKKWYCGIHSDNTVKVCCPKCYTPESQPGICEDIRLCPKYMRTLINLFETTRPAIQNARCDSAAAYSTCCPLSDEEPKRNTTCESSKYPADPRTGCCGTQANYRSNGNSLHIDDEPWLALIEYKKDEVTTISCGGVLISSGYVLTAAHCVVGQKLNNGVPTNVRLGEFDVTNEGTDCDVALGGSLDCTDGALTIPIKKIVPHPEYNPAHPSENDIALMELSKPAPYTDFIRPACLPIMDVTTEDRDDYIFTVSGWGSADKSSTTLHQKQTYEVGYDKKIKLLNPSNGTKIYATTLEANNECKGDSGGPIIDHNNQRAEVTGIESASNNCLHKDKPNVYTRVIRYKNWILNHIYDN